jgi:hypothetical protein
MAQTNDGILLTAQPAADYGPFSLLGGLYQVVCVRTGSAS